MPSQEMDTHMSNENTPDPNILGKLTDEERATITAMRQQSQEVLIKIGQIRVQEMRLLSRLDQMDAGAQDILDSVTKRLDLKEGERWEATQDGTIRRVVYADSRAD